MRTFKVLLDLRTIQYSKSMDRSFAFLQKANSQKSLFDRQKPDNGKVRRFDHEDMVLFSCCFFVYHTHLTLALLPSQIGWLLHGKYFFLFVEASSIDFRRWQWFWRSSCSFSCPLLPSRSSPTMVSTTATLPVCLIVVYPTLTSSSCHSSSLSIGSSATVFFSLRLPSFSFLCFLVAVYCFFCLL